jgi:hypothetical protein
MANPAEENYRCAPQPASLSPASGPVEIFPLFGRPPPPGSSTHKATGSPNREYSLSGGLKSRPSIITVRLLNTVPGTSPSNRIRPWDASLYSSLVASTSRANPLFVRTLTMECCPEDDGSTGIDASLAALSPGSIEHPAHVITRDAVMQWNFILSSTSKWRQRGMNSSKRNQRNQSLPPTAWFTVDLWLPITALQVPRIQARVLRNSSEHSWTDLVTIMECKNVVGISVSLQDPVRSSGLALHRPANPE